MHRFAVLVLLLLCACVQAAPYDPYTARRAADGAIEATQAAQYDRAQAATIQAGVLQSAGTATAGAWAWQQSATQAAQLATAQVAQVTETARHALETQQVQAAQATATADTAIILTQTAYPPQATATQAAVNEIRRQDEERERAARWATFVTPIQAIAPTLLCCVVLVLIILGAVLAYRRLMPVLELRMRAIPRGQHDAPLILTGQPGGNVGVWDADKNVAPGAILTPTGAKLIGMVTDLLLQARITTQDQMVDLMRSLPADAKGQKRGQDLAANLLAAPSHTTEPHVQNLPESAPWQQLSSWSGGPLPLGVGAGGLILADPECHPHFLFAGTTGSGKTRAGLRPLAALALASGWQVGIFDNSGLDFLPFRNHPNARLVKLPDPAQAVAYLQVLYRLIRQRQEQLAIASCSTWARLPGAGPRVLAIFDEFSNLADALTNQDREGLWRAARMVAAEGRKVGVHLALALQDPSHRSIDLRIRRNMTPVSFRVRDADASRVILNAAGAETLPAGQFLAGLGLDLSRGVGFSPDDDELGRWLTTRPTPALPEPIWLDLPAGETMQEGIRHDDIPQDERERIEALHAQGVPPTEIARQVYGYKGGAGYNKVRTVLGI